jgi:hypothetical protein
VRAENPACVSVHLSLDLRTSDLRFFATTNHVNLYLFLNLRTLYLLQREPINFLSSILYDYYSTVIKVLTKTTVYSLFT